MVTSDVGYDSFNDAASPALSSPHKSLPPPASDYTDTTYLRFLASNGEAGSIIGKGGSTISDFQSRSNARIQFSRSYEYYPGTSDRIIMVSGTLDEVLDAFELILTKLVNEFNAKDSKDAEPRTKLRLLVPNGSCGGIIGKGGSMIKIIMVSGTLDEVLDAFELILTKLVNEFNAKDSKDAEPRTKLRLLVPNGSCGGIIGKGGSMIKSFIEDSEANIKISPQDNSYIGLNDRLVTLSGTLQQQMVATNLILSKLSEDLNYIQSIGPPFPYAQPHSVPNHGPYGGGKKFQNNQFQNNKEDVTKSVTLAIADEHVGIVVGRSGRNIAEITQISGARIQISGRGDFIHGTTDRKVTITGSQRQINVAEAMIVRKVASPSSPPPASTPSD